MFALLFTAGTAHAWKPYTHVYLALKVWQEIYSTQDYFGNPKPYCTIPIYRTNYHTGEIVEVIGYYEMDTRLRTALENHRDDFLTGTLGPDAYPDIATGQTRIHVHAPTLTDAWLQHLWQKAQSLNQPEVTAFAAGYLNHAAGDMFMHTFINYYAGGPFTFTKDPRNAAKHVIVEGYIGKRTPELPADIVALPISRRALDFVYKNLVDAQPGTVLFDDLYQGHILNPNQLDSPLQLASFPLVFSLLRHGLQQQIDLFDATIADFDAQITERQKTAEDCGNRLNPLCVSKYAALDSMVLAKGAHITLFGAQTAYLRAWVADVDDGLMAWPRLSHELAKEILLSADGFNRQRADSLVADYRVRHVQSMLGVPDFVGGTALFIDSMKELIFTPAMRDLLQRFKENLL
ncbi:MAG: zinc dependent phospholipase C family protein, partial [bacterium]